MIRGFDPATDKFLADLTDIGRRVDRAQREITSGRRINAVSDDPDRISLLLQNRTELQQTEQIRFNLGRVQTEVDAAEQALQAAVRILERASVLGAQGVNGTTTAQQRNIIAGEVTSLLEQLIGVSRATVEGRFIFSGDADGAPPYTLDLSLTNPVSSYQGTDATRQVMHPTGTLFKVSRTAQEIFDDPDPALNVFAAVNNLRLALSANDETAMADALASIRTAEVHLNNQLAFYGTAQNQVAEATDFAHKQELRLKTHLSDIQDADMTTAILELNQTRYQQEVALTTKAKLNKVSLFDYIG